ncbi:hypothetical protein Tco_1263505 [Tanacetum coccineum]
MAELSSLRKAAEICSILWFVAYEFLEKFSIIRHSGQDIDERFIDLPTLVNIDIHMLIARLWWLVDFGIVSFWVWLSVTGKGSRGSTRLLVSKSVKLGFKVYEIEALVDFWQQCDHDSFGAFPSYEAKRRLEIRSRVKRNLGFL